MLNVRGLPSTAGVYSCEASSLAGTSKLELTLYVHGTVSSVCQAGYCLNGASCSVVTLAPGELQPVCSCSQGYAGLRCQLKHVSSNLTLTAVIITLASVTLISVTIIIIYFYKRLQQIEKILRQQDTGQRLLSQKVAARADKTDRTAWAVAPLHSYHHCGHVKTGQANGALRQQVTKSASSPGMSGLASSSESVKQRRPGAPGNESLTLDLGQKTVRASGSENLTPDLCQTSTEAPGGESLKLMDLNHKSARVSPLYMEPWDGLAELCVHGKLSQCEVCIREADTILSQCHTYSGHQTS